MLYDYLRRMEQHYGKRVNGFYDNLGKVGQITKNKLDRFDDVAFNPLNTGIPPPPPLSGESVSVSNITD